MSRSVSTGVRPVKRIPPGVCQNAPEGPALSEVTLTHSFCEQKHGGGGQIAKILVPLDLFPFAWQPDEDREDLPDAPSSSLPVLSGITADQDNVAALNRGSGPRAGRGRADGRRFGPHKNVALTASAVCHSTQNKHVFLLPVSVAGLNNPESVPEPPPGASLRLFINATASSGL